MSLECSPTPAYGVDRLSFRYRLAGGDAGNELSRWALNELSFKIREGEVFGIIGPNGSGKTSLLKLLAKVLRPRSGDIRLFREPLDAMAQDAVARLVALVPQESQQIFSFTVFEMVLMGRFPHHRRGAFTVIGWETDGDLRLAEQAMTDTDVAHLAGRSIHEISGGERQRTMIARALAQEPRVLLLDEPTAFLDLHHQLDICRILRRLNRERGLTVVLVSHDLNLAAQYCDRVMLLENGRVFRLGTPDEVIRPEALETVYGCEVLVDRHPISGLPRVTLPGR
jgi:iron complex transport system ATP-binding protein